MFRAEEEEERVRINLHRVELKCACLPLFCCLSVICACVSLFAHVCTQIPVLCIFIWSDPVTECLNGSFSPWEQWCWIPSHDRVIAQGCFSIKSPKKTPFTWHEHLAGHTQWTLSPPSPRLLPASNISSSPEIRWKFKKNHPFNINKSFPYQISRH